MEEVDYRGFDLDPSVLDLLRSRCPNLKKVAFEVDYFYGEGISSLIRFVDGCKSLRSIRVEGERSEVKLVAKHEPNPEIEFDAGASRTKYKQLLYRLLWSLAHYDGLEKLELSTFHDDRIMLKLLRQILHLERPFKDLRKLTLKLSSTGVQITAPRLDAETLYDFDTLYIDFPSSPSGWDTPSSESSSP